MSNVFVICLNAIIPICVIMLLGYMTRRSGALDEKMVLRMNGIVFRIFLPVMLFRTVYRSDLSAAVNLRLVLFTFACIAVMVLGSIGYALLAFRDRRKQGVIITALFCSNYAIVGLPVARALAGEQGAATVAVLLALTTPVLSTLIIVVLESFGGKKTNFRHLALDILKNPTIISCVLGVIFSGFDIQLPEMAEKIMDDLANVATPLSLFLLGGFFRFDGLRESLRELVHATVGRLIVLPAILLTVSYLLGFRGSEFVALMCMFASSAAVLNFTMAVELGGDQKLSGNIVIITSCLFSFTLYFWSVLFKFLGAW